MFLIYYLPGNLLFLHYALIRVDYFKSFEVFYRQNINFVFENYRFMSTEKFLIDFDAIAKHILKDKKIFPPLYYLLRKIARIDELNKLISYQQGKTDVEFMSGVMSYLELKVKAYGDNNLQNGQHPMIFVSNHPLGALDAVSIGSTLGKIYGNKVKFYANEFLSELKPVKDMFLPIHKYGGQRRENVTSVQEFFESNCHLVTFPAGATSRMRKHGLTDLTWQKNFVQKSIQYKRDVVPIYFKAQNSRFFYTLQYIREFFHLKLNIEMLLLPSEIFKQKGKNFTFYIGEPIPWQTFDKSKTMLQWATWVREIAYTLPKKYDLR